MCINYMKIEFNPKYSDPSAIRIFGWFGQFLTIAQYFQFVLLLQFIIIIIIIIIIITTIVFCFVRCFRFKEFCCNFGC